MDSERLEMARRLRRRRRMYREFYLSMFMCFVIFVVFIVTVIGVKKDRIRNYMYLDSSYDFLFSDRYYCKINSDGIYNQDGVMLQFYIGNTLCKKTNQNTNIQEFVTYKVYYTNSLKKDDKIKETPIFTLWDFPSDEKYLYDVNERGLNARNIESNKYENYRFNIIAKIPEEVFVEDKGYLRISAFVARYDTVEESIVITKEIYNSLFTFKYEKRENNTVYMKYMPTKKIYEPNPYYFFFK